MANIGETGVIECCEGRGGNGSCIRSRTVQVVNRCELGMLSRQLVRELAEQYPELRIRLAMFARMGKKFSAKGKRKKMKMKKTKHQQTKNKPTSSSPDDLLPPPSSQQIPQQDLPVATAAADAEFIDVVASVVERRIEKHLAANEQRIGEMLQASEARIAAMLAERP